MRYKGRPSEQTLARHFPHVVEITVPLGGFGKRLDAMHASLRRVVHADGRGRREGERDVTRWLFARREDAEAFARAYDGKVLDRQ